MNWEEKLSPAERRAWEQWVARVRGELVEKMAASAFVASLVPSGETDVKFAVELGLAIMLDKPIVAIVVSGSPVPGKLRDVADAVIEISDMDTEAGQAELQAKLLPRITRYARELTERAVRLQRTARASGRARGLRRRSRARSRTRRLARFAAVPGKAGRGHSPRARLRC